MHLDTLCVKLCDGEGLCEVHYYLGSDIRGDETPSRIPSSPWGWGQTSAIPINPHLPHLCGDSGEYLGHSVVEVWYISRGKY